MPAAGKDNAANIAKRQSAGETVRILITDNTSSKHASPAALAGEATPPHWYPSSVKTKVVTATVTGWSAVAVGGGRRSSRRYTLHTDKGDVPGLAPIETLWLAPEPKDKPAPAATSAAPEMARLRETAETEPAPPVAHRATMSEARRHFEAGGAVLVHERGHKETIPVFRHTTTHNRTRITWDDLTALVKEWRNRYPNQRYYIVPEETAPTDVTAAPAEPPALDGRWLRRKDDTYGQVADVERFTGALGGDECADIEYTDGTRERYLARDLPAPLPDDVAAILERAGNLTGEELERLHTVASRSYQMHRAAHIQLGHQARRAYGENWKDLGQLADRARQVVASSTDESTADRLSFAGHAVEDMVTATLAREHLADNEYRIFAGPWLDVIGD